MKLDVLTEILTKHMGARKDGASYAMPNDAELTLFVTLSGDSLTVPKVSRVEIADTLLIADGARGDRFAFPWEDVRAVKLDRSEVARRERGAGFGR